MTLSELRNTPGARKRSRRVGRGPGSGRGKTSGKGHKGQRARSGGAKSRGFEGGQMPFYRRLPKKGFNRARFRTVYSIVNLKSLNGFPEGTRITPQLLKERRLVGSLRTPVKILGDGELTVRINVVAHAFSQKAKEAIQRLGGTCEMIV